MKGDWMILTSNAYSETDAVGSLGAVENLKRMGFEAADLTVGRTYVYDERLPRLIDRAPLSLCAFHLPDCASWGVDIETIFRAIDLNAGARERRLPLITHPYVAEGVHEDTLGRLEICKKILSHAKKRGLDLLFENTDERPEDFERLFGIFPEAGLCLDVGHANLHERNLSLEFLEKFYERLRHIHLNDNRGGRGQAGDRHLPLGEGTVDFGEILSFLIERNYAGPLGIEVFDDDVGLARSLCLAREWLRDLR